MLHRWSRTLQLWRPASTFDLIFSISPHVLQHIQPRQVPNNIFNCVQYFVNEAWWLVLITLIQTTVKLDALLPYSLTLRCNFPTDYQLKLLLHLSLLCGLVFASSTPLVGWLAPCRGNARNIWVWLPDSSTSLISHPKQTANPLSHSAT